MSSIMNVEAVMTRDPKTCTTTDTLHRAANLMWETDCGVIPVVDANGRLRGLVTDRDVCMATYTQGKAPHDIQVESVMSKLLFTLAPSDSVQTAMKLLQERQVRRAPVVNDAGALVGILSLADVVHASASGVIAKDVKPDAVLAVVHALTKPRHADKPAAKIETRDVIVTPAPRGKVEPAKSAPAATKASRKK
ncbi:MAG: CBS domain-containing protein [Planctomycetota bacterium]|nr:CBS domain-containing protein [Planctomycetota bacterium]